jgi:dienelactone hydrolase
LFNVTYMKRLPVLAILMAWMQTTTGSFAADSSKTPTTSSTTTARPEGLPGTEPLTMAGDIASNLVAGVDRFLLRKLNESETQRARYWHRDDTSEEAYRSSVATNRARLARILGVRDARVPFQSPELMATLTESAVLAKEERFDVIAIRWPVLKGITAEGLLLEPQGKRPRSQIIAIPDATQTPEQLAGLEPGTAGDQAYARTLAESGFRVVIPCVISRQMGPHKGKARMTAREFLYRPAFEMGRHLIGYEVQKILAAVDWLVKEPGTGSSIGVIGWGDGGMLALYSAGLDSRIRVTCVSGYFGDRRQVWQQPVDRNVFGLLEQFGDAELASLVHPNRLIIESAKAPEAEYSGVGGGAPAQVRTPLLPEVKREVARARQLCGTKETNASVAVVISGEGTGPALSIETLQQFASELAQGTKLQPRTGALRPAMRKLDAKAREARQMDEIDRYTQELLVKSPDIRAEFMKHLDTSSPERYQQTVEPYREFFAKEIIGQFDEPLLPARPRSRKSYDREKWTGYEVVLDVFPDVIAYGLLLVPKDLQEGERRPVVVCQHGLEGRPQDTIGESGSQYYAGFAAKLAERGFVTFAPQNLYIFGDRFRTLQRKANPLGKTLFSVMVPQHQQITDWLKTLPFVDPGRIGFYGLSYGGKSAMRIPPLVTNYCLSICSGDFNDWVWKNASTESSYSYVWMNEYEIFEFDLGSTFNYAEMAALIAPRPFMVERGHFDGVAPDETVAYEFAKVRHRYAAQLRLPASDCQIEFFVGPHTVHGVGTFDFLHEHLHWPKR